MSDKIRLNLDVTQQVKDRLESLKLKSDAASITEVFKRSFACFELLIDLQLAGGKIILEKPGCPRELLRIL